MAAWRSVARRARQTIQPRVDDGVEQNRSGFLAEMMAMVGGGGWWGWRLYMKLQAQTQWLLSPLRENFGFTTLGIKPHLNLLHPPHHDIYVTAQLHLHLGEGIEDSQSNRKPKTRS